MRTYIAHTLLLDLYNFFFLFEHVDRFKNGVIVAKQHFHQLC